MQEIFEAVQNTKVLESKLERVNLCKYHHAITAGKRSLKYWSLKAFYLGIACEALGLDVCGKKRPADVALGASSGAAASSGDSEKPLTLAQAAWAQRELGADSLVPKNQLHKAGIEYADISNRYKQEIITHSLVPVAQFFSEQSKTLRSLSDVIPWETAMMRDSVKIFHAARLSMSLIGYPRIYAQCGIETLWRPMESISCNDARVAFSNDHAGLLWKLNCAIVAEEANRNLAFMSGYPKRFTLLLQADERPWILRELRADYQYYREVSALTDAWAVELAKRSPFATVPVRQIVEALEIENWVWTDRNLCYLPQQDCLFLF